MSALTCDICGGNLTMNENGEFAVCECCGMKHTKERVREKVQEISGVVEITKGEAEKERLIKNAETFIEYGQIDLAEKIYVQLVKEYPNDWVGWAGNAYVQLFHFPSSLSSIDVSEFIKNKHDLCKRDWRHFDESYERDYYKFAQNFFSRYEQFEYYSSVAKKISLDEFQCYIKLKWAQHDQRHNQYISNLENMLQRGTPCFDELSKFFVDNVFIPSKIRKIITQLSENADKVNTVFVNSKNRYNNFYLLGKTDLSFHADGVKRIDKVDFLSLAQAVLSGVFCDCENIFHCRQITVSFGKTYTIEKLIQTLNIPTGEEIDAPKLKEAKQLVASIKYNKLALQKILQQYTNRDIKENNEDYINYSYEIEDIDKNSIKYCVTYYRKSRWVTEPLHESPTVYFNTGDFEKIIVTLRQLNDKCGYCGGELKGVFKKICSKCGKPKDY